MRWITKLVLRRDTSAVRTRRACEGAMLAVLLVGAWFADVAAAATGRTAGMAGVTRDGEAAYVIPIRVTPGVAGLTPELAIAYGVPGARGTLGAGFSLTGLSAITPCARTRIQDDTPAPVTLTTTDVYCVDGQRLRLVSGTYGANNAQYRTEIDRTMRVTSFGAAGKQPTWFRIERSNGLVYEYGNMVEARARSSASSAAVTFVWALNRIVDRSGNTVTFRYENDPATGLFRPNYIDYTATAAGAPEYRIDFVYQALDRPDPVEASTPSSTEPATLAEKRLLSRIDLKHLGVRYRKYLLNYDTGPGQTSRLVSLQECTDSSADCFAPTRFTWQAATPGFGDAIASSATVPLPAWPIDLNGDGYDDLVWAQAGTWRTMIGSANGYGMPVNTGTPATNPAVAIPLEWDGDGRMDLLVDWSDGAWRVLRGTATGLSAPVHAGAGGVSSDTTSSWTVADLDGDGRDDLVRASSIPRRFYSRLNSSSGFTLEGIYNLGFLFAPAAVAFPASAHGTTDTRRIDFDHDGREDFAVQGCEWDLEKNKCITETAWWVFLSDGARLYTQGILYPSASGGAPAFGDFNADHLTDIVYRRADGTIVVALSRGRTGFAHVAGPSTAGYATDLRVADYDGDGYDDLLLASNPSPGKYWWHVFRGTGAGLSSVPIATDVPGLNSVVADVNGDGLADLARAASNGAWSWFPHLGVPGDLLAKVSDGFGVSAEWTRAPMSSAAVYKRGTGAAYPLSDLGGSRPLVSRLRQTDGSGTGAAFDLAYSYEAARVHQQGRGWLGFATRTTRDDRLNYDLELKETYSQTFPYIGLLASRVLRRQTGSVLSDVVNTWASVGSGTPLVNERRLPYLVAAVARDYSSAGVLFRTTTSSIASIDSTSGLALEQTITITENATGVAPGSSRTTRIVHTASMNDALNWCLGRPTTTQTTTGHTAPGGTSVTRTFSQSWDGPTCRVTQQQLQPGDARLQVTLAYAYDAFGNVASEKITGVGMPSRTTAIDWGVTGQFPEATTNALAQTSTMSWDAALGVPLSARDPNLLTTTWGYDGFGRLVSEQHPDQTSTSWTRSGCAACDMRTEYQMTEAVSSATGAAFWSETREIDHHDRVWKVAAEMTGGGDSVASVDFDARGRVSTRRLPVVPGGPQAGFWRYTYDEWDRILAGELRRPGGSVERSLAYEYDGLQQRATDPLGRATVAISNAWGDIVRLTDAANRTTVYDYDPFRQPTRVLDAAGNQLTAVTYNVRGMKVGQTDLDLGAWVIEPNALGEIVRVRDARTASPGWSTLHTYDLLGRLTSRQDVAEGNTATFVYGTSATARNIGKLQSASAGDGSYTESFTYDSVGRLARRRIVADATYDYDYAYNALGLLATLQYPISTGGYRFKAGFEYANGHVTGILDASATPTRELWRLTTIDAAGRAIDERLGSNIQLLNGFDDTTGLLETRTAGVAGATTLQDLEYTWDDGDKLTSRLDHNQAGLTETFAYDELNRLDRSWRNGVLNLDVAYDALGNIASKFEEGVGTFAYQYHPTKKHAVTAAGPNTYTYDANGNMQSRNGATTTWYSFNLPGTITQGAGNSSQFWYGPDRRRWKQVATSSGVTETTVYVGGLMEKVVKGGVTTYRHYVPSPGSASALYLRKSSGSPSAATYYVLTDHLGSTHKVVDDAGTTLATQSYSAFGRRRGSTWAGVPSAADMSAAAATTRDGYTGHEMLDNVALVHMNGRVYDPAIGRFLSADPFVTSPYDPQAFNRYSYVTNNPLSLVDPSGFSAADGDRPPLLCDDGCLAWFFADFTYGYVPFHPYFGPFPPVTEPRSTPVPPRPPFNGQGRSLAPDLSAFSGLAVDSPVAGGVACLRAGVCASGPLPHVTFDNFVDFMAGVGDVLLGTVSLGITDGPEYRRVMDIGSVDLNSKSYQAGFWGTIFASAGLARTFAPKPVAVAPAATANPALEIAPSKALVPLYPSANGFVGGTTRTTLPIGGVVDRYGGSDISRFFSPAGTSRAARSLPHATRGQSLRQFEVLQPFEVESGYAAPWFGEPGLGVQYRSPLTLRELIDQGYLREVVQ